jgi:hypothetical protein
VSSDGPVRLTQPQDSLLHIGETNGGEEH